MVSMDMFNIKDLSNYAKHFFEKVEVVKTHSNQLQIIRVLLHIIIVCIFKYIITKVYFFK